MSTTNSAPLVDRCQHRTRTGRQCRSIVTSAGSLLCAHHVATMSSDSVDFSAELIPEGEHLQEAQQINHSLISLYKLVAAGCISPRRASTLAYIAHLILNTHKAIDYDNKTRWRRRPAGTTERPIMLTLGQMAAVSTQPASREPLPATAEAFAAAVTNRIHNSTS